MMILPRLPEDGECLCGKLCIPEELDLNSVEQSDEEVDKFVQALIESMSKPLRGGYHG